MEQYSSRFGASRGSCLSTGTSGQTANESGVIQSGVLSVSRLLIVTLTIAGCTWLAGCRPAADKRLTVFAAASTIGAMDEVLAEFRNQTGRSVRVSYGSSSSLARLMIEGAEADVFLSANIQWADEVTRNSSNIVTTPYLSNELVLVTQIESDLKIKHQDDHPDLLLDDLALFSFNRIAIADPDSVPAGIYAKRYLEAYGHWEALKERVAAAANVRQALALVEQGAAEIGIVYATDARASRHVRVLARLPLRDHPIVYTLLWRNRAESDQDDGGVDELVKFMRSQTATLIFFRHGFVPLENKTAETTGL